MNVFSRTCAGKKHRNPPILPHNAGNCRDPGNSIDFRQMNCRKSDAGTHRRGRCAAEQSVKPARRPEPYAGCCAATALLGRAASAAQGAGSPWFGRPESMKSKGPPQNLDFAGSPFHLIDSGRPIHGLPAFYAALAARPRRAVAAQQPA